MQEDIEAELAKVESELEELLEERRIEMARPMRGVERDRLRHAFERAEARLRARTAVLSNQNAQATASVEDER